jgi:HlyD family secretion protein
MNKKPVVIAVIGIGLALAAYVWSGRGNSNDKALQAYGNVDIRDVSMAFRVAGRVAQVAVDEGAVVKPGTLLATLDTEPLLNNLHTAQANLAAVSSRNAMIHLGYRAQDKAQAKSRVDAAEAALQEAEKQWKRQRELTPEGAATQHALDVAQSARDQAAAQLAIAKQQLNQQLEGYRKEEVAESDGLLAQAKAAVDAAQLALRDASLVATGDGVVLTRAVEPGSMVQAGTPAFNISLTRPVWIRAYVGEAQLGHFAPGAKVSISTDARPDKPYRGVVGFVSPTAEFTPKNVETADLRTSLVYRIRVVVQDADSQLRQGMPATVKVAQ